VTIPKIQDVDMVMVRHYFLKTFLAFSITFLNLQSLSLSEGSIESRSVLTFEGGFSPVNCVISSAFLQFPYCGPAVCQRLPHRGNIRKEDQFPSFGEHICIALAGLLIHRLDP
jgi:hypothetical protein